MSFFEKTNSPLCEQVNVTEHVGKNISPISEWVNGWVSEWASRGGSHRPNLSSNAHVRPARWCDSIMRSSTRLRNSGLRNPDSPAAEALRNCLHPKFAQQITPASYYNSLLIKILFSNCYCQLFKGAPFRVQGPLRFIKRTKAIFKEKTDDFSLRVFIKQNY